MKQIKNYTTTSDILHALTEKGFIHGVAGMLLLIVLTSFESIINLACNLLKNMQ